MTSVRCRTGTGTHRGPWKSAGCAISSGSSGVGSHLHKISPCVRQQEPPQDGLLEARQRVHVACRACYTIRVRRVTATITYV